MVLEKTVVHPPPQGFALNLPGRLNVSLAETGTQVMLNHGMSFGDDAADRPGGSSLQVLYKPYPCLREPVRQAEEEIEDAAGDDGAAGRPGMLSWQAGYNAYPCLRVPVREFERGLRTRQVVTMRQADLTEVFCESYTSRTHIVREPACPG